MQHVNGLSEEKLYERDERCHGIVAPQVIEVIQESAK
jgi:hypothetical protein